MTSRERLQATLNHQQPDHVCVDFGATAVTGIHVSVVDKLRKAVVGDPHYRGNALVLQTPHNTAVLVERATRVEWAVDMWPRGYAQPPDVMTVEKWVTED
jgi:hypothetical protein